MAKYIFIYKSKKNTFPAMERLSGLFILISGHIHMRDMCSQARLKR